MIHSFIIGIPNIFCADLNHHNIMYLILNNKWATSQVEKHCSLYSEKLLTFTIDLCNNVYFIFDVFLIFLQMNVQLIYYFTVPTAITHPQSQ